MKATKYTIGFEKFWRTWRGVTGRVAGKPEAFKYWKRDKLEGDEDELIRRLLLQAGERKRIKSLRIWQPEWCFCRKWLNNRRYEYVPEPPEKRITKILRHTKEEEQEYAKRNTPEARAAKAEYVRLRDKLFGG